MASPIQRSSTQRKLVYFALILGLYVVNTFFWRGVASPLTAGAAPPWTLTAQADALELRDETKGDADLVGSTVRLGLTGSRGLAVMLLWKAAIDRQMKHEWNELELLVRTLTKLQPHFLTPWLFQSWNLSYNVSVESDRVKDKYFYIARGIELLAQGERMNRDNPDMRFWLGFYFQNKFGVSDERNTLRSLLQMSMIDPAKRDPEALRRVDPATRRRTVNLAEFEQFCKDNPQLVRRLRDALRCSTPDDVIDFLADNRKIPCRFVDPETDAVLSRGKLGELKSPEEQFPVLPINRPRLFPSEPTASSTLGDSFCNFHLSRVWFAYAMDPLPDPEIMTTLKTRAERLAEPGNRGKRMPRSPAEIIFRGYPARAQSYIAERLQNEGWFDESGWAIDQGRTGRSRWFPHDVVVGNREPWSSDAWAAAYAMWRKHGIENGLYLDAPTEERLRELALRFRNRFKLQGADSGEQYRLDTLDPEMQKCALAYRQLFYREQNLGITNFMHHYARAMAEQDREAVQARKALFEAERFARAAEPERALASFERGFDLLKQVMLNPRFTDFRNDGTILEETYEKSLVYLDLLRKTRGAEIRPMLVVGDLLLNGAATAAQSASPGTTAGALVFAAVTDQRTLPIPFVGPFDGYDPTGRLWVPQHIADEAVQRRLRDRPQIAQPPPTVESAPKPAG